MNRVNIPFSEFHDFCPKDGSKLYRLFLYVPNGKPPAQGWPMLCMLDGNAVFASAVDTMRAQAADSSGTNVTQGVIAAIGYPTLEAYDLYRRSWDLTPPPGRTYPPFTANGPEVHTGGAVAFLELIKTTILPWIASRVPINEQRRSLFGHSFGGLCTLYALFNHPTLFRHYIAASPSIEWEDFTLVHSERSFLASPTDGRPIDVYLTAGEYEGASLAPFLTNKKNAAKQLAYQKSVNTLGNTRDMAERLNKAKRPGLKATFEMLAKETHMSAIPTAINRAVRATFTSDA